MAERPARDDSPTTAPAVRRGYQDYFGAYASERDPDLPRPGDAVWYRLRSDRKWVRAIVLDAAVEGLDEPLGGRMVHLAVDLSHLNAQMTIARFPDGDGGYIEEPDPERRLAASRLGFRQNVTEGARPGEWQREKPADAETVYEREQAEKSAQVAMRRDMAQHGGINATHSGRLPSGVKN